MEFMLLKSLYPSVKKVMASETQEASKIPGDFWTFTLENVHSLGAPRTPPVLLEAELGGVNTSKACCETAAGL